MQSSTATQRLLFADSKNRDVRLFPSGNNYVLHLTTPIKDIERVDLVSARVPNTMFNLTLGSNVLAVNSSNVSLNPGFYSVYGLAAALGITSPTGLGLDYLPDEGHFLFSSSAPFTLLVHSQELATMLGLSRGSLLPSALATATDPSYSANYILRSSTLVDLSLNEYIFLDIDELRTPSHVDTGSLQGNTGTVSGSNANRNFAPVMMDVGSACIKNFHEHKDYRVSVEYPEPIASLQRLTVRWVDKSGNPLDFRGWDTNAFVLRIHIRAQERPPPPPPPLQDVEIRRIVEAMTFQIPKPDPKETSRPKIQWWLIVLAILGFIFVWKSRPSSVGTVPLQAPVKVVQFQRPSA
jgi:hypothetical protein